MGEFGLAGLGALPQLVIDDAQLRHLGSDPLGFGVAARDAPARARVLDEALAVPHQAQDIELVVEDAVAPAGVAADRGVAPGAPEWAGHAFMVEAEGDGAGRSAGSKLAEDAAHDLGLRLVVRRSPRTGSPAALRFTTS